jgi:hypothetical protein
MSEEERKRKPFFLKRFSIVIILFVFITYLLPLFIHIFVHLTGLSNYENRLVLQFYLLWSANLLMLIGITSIIIFPTVWMLKEFVRMNINLISANWFHHSNEDMFIWFNSYFENVISVEMNIKRAYLSLSS